ncbi:hypothetical protein PTI98_011742 [Pleurotus ostreatus]|nr:hypothetical protein PTI98_011742 [Pleurotus ostreatus]
MINDNDHNNAPIPKIKIATDGSCLRASTQTAAAGSGIFYKPDDERNKGIRVPSTFVQTNQTGEMTAVLVAIEDNMATQSEIEIESDSKYAINTLTKNLANLEDTGYIGKANQRLIQLTVAKMRASRNQIKFRWVKGHNGHEGNEAADRLADAGARKAYQEVPEVNLEIPINMRLTGAKLSKMTQSLAYRAIRDINADQAKQKDRRRTQKMIDMIQNHVKEVLEEIPTEERIWNAILHKDLSRQIRYYLWMVAHDAYCIGTHWLKDNYSEELQKRSECAHCHGAIEDMAHILSRCETPGQEQVWSLAKDLWTKTGREWTQPWVGNIVACALTKKTDGPKRDAGGERLWRIIVSESAHLIWKLRCERVIQNENAPFTTQEVNNRWLTTINARLDTDREMTNENLGKHKIKTKVVLQTWKGALEEEKKLNGVLVGIKPRPIREEGG